MHDAEKPHDALFRETFGDPVLAAAQLRAVLPRGLVEALEWSSLRVESGSFVGVGEESRHCDLLFSVEPVGGRGPVLVFVLFEHQSANDRLMALRMLGYMIRIWTAWVRQSGVPSLPLPPIVPVVLCHDERGWRAQHRFAELFELEAETASHLRPFLPDFGLVLDDLAQASDQDLAARRMPAGATLTLWALRDGRSGERVLEHAVFWAPFFEALAQQSGGQAVVDRLMRYLGVAGGESSVALETLADKLIEHGPKTRQAIMNSVEKLIEKGRQQGMQQGMQRGMQQGRAAGRREVLLKILRANFGEPGAAEIARVESADEATLDAYIERSLTADSLAAVFGA